MHLKNAIYGIGKILYQRFKTEYLKPLEINSPIKFNNTFTSLFYSQIMSDTNYVNYVESEKTKEKIIAFESTDDIVSFFDVPADQQIHDIPEIYRKNEDQPLLQYIRRPRVSCNNGMTVALIKCARSDFVERNWIRDYYTKMAKKVWNMFS